MAFIDWNNNLSVNIHEIDQQHLILIDMINNLHEAMKQGKGKEITGEIIDGLSKYTATHFKTEEDYFDIYGYPEAESHKKEHADFVSSVMYFKEGYANGKMSLSIDVMQFLGKWLQNHIIGSDKRYSKYLNNKGLK